MRVILLPWHWRCRWTGRMLLLSMTATADDHGALYRDWIKVWG